MRFRIINSGLLFFIFFVLLSFGIVPDSFQQDHKVITSYTYVIASEGLDMKTAPDIMAETIINIPFGEQIEYVEDISYGLDTLGYDTLYYHRIPNKSIIIPYVGDWVKVKYNNQTGFVFNMYLFGSNYLLKNNIANVNTDYVLLFPEMDCYSNWYPPDNFFWYGVYRVDDEYEIRPVEISYYFYNAIPGPGFLVTSTNDNKNLCFIIGSNKSYRVGDVKGRTYSWKEGNLVISRQIKSSVLNEHSLSLKIDTNSNGHFGGYSLFLNEEYGNKQLLNLNKNWVGPITLYWKGDLDGDSQNDYIISFGDKCNGVVLYLSSEAVTPDEIVRPVAVNFGGYCC